MGPKISLKTKPDKAESRMTQARRSASKSVRNATVSVFPYDSRFLFFIAEAAPIIIHTRTDVPYVEHRASGEGEK
jgi:hypothetical protein